MVKKSHNVEKPKKRSFRLIQRFLQTENFKKMQIFEKKTSHSAEKNPKGDPLVSPVLLEALKNLWFSARIEPTLSGLVEDEQI